MFDEEKEIEKVLIKEMELTKVDLNENERCQLVGVLAQMKKILNEQEINDVEEIAVVIENYIKSTVSFVDEIDNYSCEEMKNSRYDTAYAALVMKRSTTLGVANAVKLMLKVLDIDSVIGEFHNTKKDCISYFVAVDASHEDYEDEGYFVIDPYNSLVGDKTFLRLETLYNEGKISDLY